MQPDPDPDPDPNLPWFLTSPLLCCSLTCFVWLTECLEQANNLKDLKNTHQKCQHKERQMKRVWSRIYIVSSQNRHFQGKGTWHSHLHHQSRHWGVKKKLISIKREANFYIFFSNNFKQSWNCRGEDINYSTVRVCYNLLHGNQWNTKILEHEDD